MKQYSQGIKKLGRAFTARAFTAGTLTGSKRDRVGYKCDKVQCKSDKIRKICREAIHLIKTVDLGTLASSLAFTTVLSIAPLLAIAFYVFKLFGGLEYGYSKLEPFLLSNLSEGSGEIVVQYLQKFMQQVHAKAVGWAGVGGLFVTAILTYFTVSKALNRIWEVKKFPPIHKRIGKALVVLLLGPLLVSLSLAVTALVSSQISNIPYSGYLVGILLNTLVYTLIYTLVPNAKTNLKIAFLGSLLPACLWEIAKSTYTIYTTRIVSYSSFYGSLAAIPIFLFWIYIGWYIALLGAVCVRALSLNAVKNSKH